MIRYIYISISLLLLVSCTLPGTTPPNSSGSMTGVTRQDAKIASPTYGSGKHTLTIFADFQCPACISFAKTIGPVFEDYASKGQLQITYKQFPLTAMHKNAERDALAGLCSAEQGKYMEYKKVLYALEETKSSAKVTDEERVTIAKDILDTAKLAECLKTDKYLLQVRAEMKEGDQLGVTGTPTVFFDGKKLDSSFFRDIDALKTIMGRWLEVPVTSTGSVK